MKFFSAWNFLQHSIQVYRGAYIPYFKINAPNFCCFIFFQERLNLQVRFNKMVNEHTVDYPPSPPEFTSRINHLIFYGLLRGLYLENIEYFLNFFLIPVYLTMVAKKFQIDGVKITGKYICESKHWICLLMPPRKTLH